MTRIKICGIREEIHALAAAEAGADFDRALQLEPTYMEARRYRGEAKVRAGDLGGAIADFSTVLNRSTNRTLVRIANEYLAELEHFGPAGDRDERHGSENGRTAQTVPAPRCHHRNDEHPQKHERVLLCPERQCGHRGARKGRRPSGSIAVQ